MTTNDRKPLPKELQEEEGIPEAIEAMRQAMADPGVRELIRRREEALKAREVRLDVARHNVRLEVAHKLRARGMDRPAILEITGLPPQYLPAGPEPAPLHPGHQHPLSKQWELEDAIAAAEHAVTRVWADDGFQEWAEGRMKFIRDSESRLADAWQEGYRKGLKKKARKRILEIARRLHKEGIDKEEILQLTRLRSEDLPS